MIATAMIANIAMRFYGAIPPGFPLIGRRDAVENREASPGKGSIET